MKRGYWVVLVILLIAGGVAAARLAQRGGSEKRQRALDELERIEFALDRYAKDNGDYPSTEQGLRALWEYPVGLPAPSNWNGPYLEEPVLTDPWEHPYVYRRPGRHDRYTYDLFSYGADGVEGGSGDGEDVVSWLKFEEL